MFGVFFCFDFPPIADDERRFVRRLFFFLCISGLWLAMDRDADGSTEPRGLGLNRISFFDHIRFDRGGFRRWAAPSLTGGRRLMERRLIESQWPRPFFFCFLFLVGGGVGTNRPKDIERKR